MEGKGEWNPDEQEHKPQMPLQAAKGAAFVGGRRAEVARVEVPVGVKGSSAPECSTGCGEELAPRKGRGGGPSPRESVILALLHTKHN